MAILFDQLGADAQAQIVKQLGYAPGQKQHKYHAHRTTRIGPDGETITFPSKHEAQRWDQLRYMQQAGQIWDLRRQVRYALVPPQNARSGKNIRGVSYVADFVYKRLGKSDGSEETVVEDAKGFRTETFQIKQKLMLWIHGIEVQEV